VILPQGVPPLDILAWAEKPDSHRASGPSNEDFLWQGESENFPFRTNEAVIGDSLWKESESLFTAVPGHAPLLSDDGLTLYQTGGLAFTTASSWRDSDHSWIDSDVFH
jgi:hypothetical protein